PRGPACRGGRCRRPGAGGPGRRRRERRERHPPPRRAHPPGRDPPSPARRRGDPGLGLPRPHRHPREGAGMTSATTTALRTEARLAGREIGSLFWIVIFPTGLLAILGAIPSFREPNADMGGQRMVDLYVSTAVITAIIMAAIFTMPGVVANYRERGILRRLRTTPV